MPFPLYQAHQGWGDDFVHVKVTEPLHSLLNMVCVGSDIHRECKDVVLYPLNVPCQVSLTSALSESIQFPCPH